MRYTNEPDANEQEHYQGNARIHGHILIPKQQINQIIIPHAQSSEVQIRQVLLPSFCFQKFKIENAIAHGSTMHVCWKCYPGQQLWSNSVSLKPKTFDPRIIFPKTFCIVIWFKALNISHLGNLLQNPPLAVSIHRFESNRIEHFFKTKWLITSKSRKRTSRPHPMTNLTDGMIIH